MQKRKLIACALLIFLAGCFLTFVVMVAFIRNSTKQSGKELILEYGDSFSDIPLLSENGNEENLLKGQYEYTFVYYLDKNCGTCIGSLEIINHICKIYDAMNISNMVIWDGEIGVNHIQKYGISSDINYSLDDAYINVATPAFYILDENLNVIFRATDMEDMLTKICLLDVSEKETINEKYINQMFEGSNIERPVLVYFSMVGCPDCEETNSIVESLDIQDSFHVLTFYRDKDNVPEEYKNSIDYGGLLAKIYGIDWYPSFLILHSSGEYEVIGEMDSPEIKEKLLSHIN